MTKIRMALKRSIAVFLMMVLIAGLIQPYTVMAAKKKKSTKEDQKKTETTEAAEPQEGDVQNPSGGITYGEWTPEKQEIVWNVINITDWSQLDKYINFDIGNSRAEAKVDKALRDAMEKPIRKLLKKELGKDNTALKGYVEIMLGLCQIMGNKGKYSKNDDPYNASFWASANTRQYDRKASILVIFSRLLAAQRTWNKFHPEMPFSVYQVNDALKMVIQGVIYGEEFCAYGGNQYSPKKTKEYFDKKDSTGKKQHRLWIDYYPASHKNYKNFAEKFAKIYTAVYMIGDSDSVDIVQGVTITGSDMGAQIAAYALSMYRMCRPYTWGGESYIIRGDGKIHTDCSGFVTMVLAHFGLERPGRIHSTNYAKVSGHGHAVKGGIKNALPGDVIVYNGHVMIYIGKMKVCDVSSWYNGKKNYYGGAIRSVKTHRIIGIQRYYASDVKYKPSNPKRE